LLISPESLLGASFQLSFAAVVALVAAYESWDTRRLYRHDRGRLWLVPLAYLGGIALTSLIAGTATAPIAAYHFNRFQLYGVIANMAAVPVTGFWIMPLAALALLLMPFGLDHWVFVAMGLGIEAVIWIAETVSSWPGAAIMVPGMPGYGFLAVVAGGLWLCLWRRPWRWWGAVALAAGLASIGLARPPDILVAESGRLIAARDSAGRLALSSTRRATYTAEVWLRENGRNAVATWPKAGEAWPDGGLRCDSTGCVYRAKGYTVALVERGEALSEDCRIADIVISAEPTFRRCRGPRLVIDRFDLWREGAHVLWLDGDGPRLESVADARGQRPWTPKPQARRRPSPATAELAGDGDAQ